MESVLVLGLTNALLATVLALVAVLLAWLCRRPALTHALWLLVLARLIIPPIFSISLLSTDAHTEGSDVPSTPPLLISVPQAAPTLVHDEPGSPVAFHHVEERSTLPWSTILVILWSAGSTSWWLLASWRLVCFQQILRLAEEAPADLQARVQQLATRLGIRRAPQVMLIDAPLSPLLWAFIGRPRLLLPRDLWDMLSPAQQDAVLVHELAHLRRGDPWVRRLELLVMGLYWWHPVVWWASRSLHEAEEQCCDAWVVWALPDAAEAYAELLVKTVTWLTKPEQAVPFPATGMGRIRSLERRLCMIVLKSCPRGLNWGSAFLVLSLAVTLPLTPRLARTEEDPPLQQPQSPPLLSQELLQIPPLEPGTIDEAIPPRGKQPPTTAAKVKYLNSLRLRINYKLENAPATRGGDLQLWYTKDGSDWALYPHRQAKSGPLTLEFGEEGRVGITLLVRDKDGNGKPVPKKGDSPQFEVVIDVTPPVIEVHRLPVNREKKTVTIEWQVTDRNLDELPVQVWTQWGDAPQATWVEKKAKGSLEIPFNRARGPLSYRIVACDRAGNKTEYDGGTVIGTGPEPEAIITDVEADAEPAKVPALPSEPDIAVWQQRDIHLPINRSKAAKDALLRLFVTRDNGRTWELAATAAPEERQFVYRAPADGLYGFVIQLENESRNDLPAIAPGTTPQVRVLVDTTSKGNGATPGKRT